MLEVRNVSAAYGQHPALQDVSLRVNKGEIVVILGANGAGKSTLLKAISGICEGKVSGSITMRGHELLKEPPHRIVEEGIALVPEGRGIFADLNVEENLSLGAYSERARDDAASNMERVLTLFPKLRDRRRQIVRTMSGGEQQMVAIGRAMMSNPAILALDEPSLGLSPLLSKELFQALARVRDAGIGILLVEQNARASLAIADRGYLLENTKITKEGTGQSLAHDPAVQRAYLGGAGAKTQPTVAAKIVTPSRPQSGPSPTDIATQAMQSLAAPQKRATAPPPQPLAKVTPPPKAAPKPAEPIRGIDTSALVSRAHEISSAQYPRAPTYAKQPTTKPPRSSTPMPDLTAHDDRLKTVLQEIEAAAAKARRPAKQNRND